MRSLGILIGLLVAVPAAAKDELSSTHQPSQETVRNAQASRNAYESCILDKSIQFDKSRESIETVVNGAETACSKEHYLMGIGILILTTEIHGPSNDNYGAIAAAEHLKDEDREIRNKMKLRLLEARSSNKVDK